MAKSKHRSSNRRKGERNRASKPQESSATNEIEAQLERQRRKRALESSADSKPQTPQVLGGYEYDSAKKAYFPKGSGVSEKKKKHQTGSNAAAVWPKLRLHNIAFHDGIPIRQIPTLLLGHTGEMCTVPRRFHDLRAHWTGRIVLNTMQVESSARRQLDLQQHHMWALLFPQLRRSPNQQDRPAQEMPWDLGCKTSLHSSSRTFDVQQGADQSRLPDVATLVDGGTFVRLSEPGPRVWNDRHYLGSEWERSTCFEADRGNCMLRFAPRDASNYPNLVRLNSRRQGEMDLVHLRPVHSNSMRVDVSCCNCNDVAFHPLFAKGSGSVAVAPQIGRNTKQVTLHRDIRSGTSFNIKTSQFSRSDALCVDYLNENTLLFGHRNGAISLLDKRREHIQMVASADMQGGSTTSVLPLANGCMFLAKKSFGSCQMFDIRKMSESKDSAMVWHLQVPRGTANATLSSCCSGVAVDPTQTIAISPFADGQRRGHFALWSLTTGHLIGSKPIQNSTLNTLQGQSSIGLPHCELRSTITPSWQLGTEQDGNNVVKRKSNAWSLWFKSGEVDSHAPRCMGSIHQLTFRGRPDELDDRCQIENLQYKF